MISFLKLITTAAIAAFIIGAVFVAGNFIKERFLFNPSEGEWQTYTSRAFNFEITVPPNWTIIEFPNDEIAPRVNIYLEKLKPIHPVTHHSDIPNVSIFPRGVPTEGFFGEFVDSDISFSEEIRVAHDFVLKDGSRFATFASFTNVPESWNESGFVWSKIKVRGFNTSCFRGELKLQDAECDPLTGDMIIYSGRIKEEERDIEKRILSSFQFVP
ncbi:MAG: hypothetical protein HYT93_03625 [Parcubacteria group bacterium]|nr:hypothetical protein [Parcubacteria group bacterium]